MYRYIGNKLKLAPHILEKVNQLIGSKGTVADIMAGTGMISLELRKQGYSVIASDIMTYSYHHLVANLMVGSEPKFEVLIRNNVVPLISDSPYISVLQFLNLLPAKTSFFYNEFSPDGQPSNGGTPRKYFTSDNAGKIDSIREKINE